MIKPQEYYFIPTIAEEDIPSLFQNQNDEVNKIGFKRITHEQLTTSDAIILLLTDKLNSIRKEKA